MKRDRHSENKYCDVHTLALFLNMTPRRVQQLVRQGVIGKGDKRGEYELMSCIHSYQNHLKRLISHYAGFYAGKGGKEKIKQKNRIERRIYCTTAVDDISAGTGYDNHGDLDLFTCAEGLFKKS
jgi:hypothetical protein